MELIAGPQDRNGPEMHPPNNRQFQLNESSKKGNSYIKSLNNQADTQVLVKKWHVIKSGPIGLVVKDIIRL